MQKINMRLSAVVVNDGYICGTGKLNYSSKYLSNKFLMLIVHTFEFCKANITSLQALNRMPINHIFYL